MKGKVKELSRPQSKIVAAKKRKIGRKRREPILSDLVLWKYQHNSEAAEGPKKKFMRPYEGSFRIIRVMTP
jgi:hypothetical protein